MIGEYIKLRRQALGLTLEEVGNFVGVSKSTVKKWETGHISNMRRDRIALLAKILQIEPAALFGGNSPIESNIKDLCTQNGISIISVLDKLNIPILKDNEQYSDESIKKLCDYFHVSPKFLKEQTDEAICPCCNYPFGLSNKEDREIHTDIHNKFLAAVKEFGFCWGPIYRNEVKNIASGLISDESSSKEEIRQGCILKMKVYFSRSLAGCGYSLKHIDFEKYCAALLGQEEYSKRIPESVFKSLVNEYGTNDLIPSGTYYVIPKTEQAEDECVDLTPQEEILLSNYRQLNPDGQKKVDGYVEDLVKGGLYPADDGEEVAVAARSFGTNEKPPEKLKLKKRPGAGSILDAPDYKE